MTQTAVEPPSLHGPSGSSGSAGPADRPTSPGSAGAPRPGASGIADPPGGTRPRPDPIARGSLAALLLATGALYIWGLAASGWANAFYSAAAQAGSQDWTAWFFGSLDAGNSITVDKPPAAIWLMALSVRLFGLNSWSILVPQALLGVGSVALLYATLRRSLLTWRTAPGQTHPLSARGAHWAALLGAAVFALTPVATLMFRFNNPDALLVFTMTLASYLTVRAAETGSRGRLALAGVAIGLGFLTKMLQAFLVLPALVVAYWVAAPRAWRRKLVDLLVAFAAVVVSAGWYVAIVELMPASMRPFVGGSQTNSLLELIVGYNGFGRITGNEVGSVGGGNGARWGETGLLRMFEGVSGGMVSWLIPAALVLGFGALGFVLARSRTASADGRQSPAQAVAGGLTVWLGWLIVTAGVFSFMGGIYHDYYTVALAPAIGGAVALGGAVLWTHRGHPMARVLLALAAIATGAWAWVLLQQAGGWYAMLGWPVLGLSLAGGVGLVWASRPPRLLAAAALGGTVLAGLAGPAAYSLDTAATPHTGSIVTAGPVSSRGPGGGGRGPGGQANRPAGGQDGTGAGRSAPGGQPGPGSGNGGAQGGSGSGNGQPAGPGSGSSQPGGTTGNSFPQGSGSGSQQGGSTGSSRTGRGGSGQAASGGRGGGGMGGLLNGTDVSSELVTQLQQGASGFTWVAASIGAQNAASYQLASGYPVMAIGGFNGSDPSPTLAQFQQYVAEGRVHYFLGGELGGRQNGGSEAAREVAAWVAENFTATTVGGTTVYDLTQAG